VSIREALRELELWGAGAVFSLTPYTDSKSVDISIIKDWKDLVNQVSWQKKITLFNLMKDILLALSTFVRACNSSHTQISNLISVSFCPCIQVYNYMRLDI